MPQRYAAAVNCPNCGTRFQVPIEQILDIRVDPAARNRMVSGTVNMANCPACGAGGPLSLPFIYHDPESEVALLYLPVDSGSNEVERQQAAGQLTRQLMDEMPPEERKGYLLQPETFINMETMIKRVLELEGITDEDMERSQAQRQFLNDLLMADEDQWPTLVAENTEFINEEMFSLVEYILQLAGASGTPTEEFQKVDALHTYMVKQTELGQTLEKRSNNIRVFAENPSRETLVDALVNAADEESITILAQSGMPLMDYTFFQSLLNRIEEAPSDEEKERLQEVRRKILEFRESVMAASQQVAQERMELIAKIMQSEDPVKMASSHLSMLDDAFSNVLGAQIQEAQNQGNKSDFEALQGVATVVSKVMESTMPPEVALARQLMLAPDDATLNQQLQTAKEMLTPGFFQFLDGVLRASVEQQEEETTEKIQNIVAKAAAVAPEAAQVYRQALEQAMAQAQQEQPPAVPEAPEDDGPSVTPSGLIIAKR